MRTTEGLRRNVLLGSVFCSHENSHFISFAVAVEQLVLLTSGNLRSIFYKCVSVCSVYRGNFIS